MAYGHISIEEMHDLTKENKKLMILDVRSEEEFETVRIPGSYCIPLPVFSVAKMKELMDKNGFANDDPIYVTCKVGPRAVAACEMLENDFDKVYHLVGCMDSWIEEELPVESGEIEE